jgi:hypothetical protein
MFSNINSIGYFVYIKSLLRNQRSGGIVSKMLLSKFPRSTIHPMECKRTSAIVVGAIAGGAGEGL